MSLSKVARKCQICDVGKGIYSCPRCDTKYCSSFCYKSQKHQSCSESFFREWVTEALKEESRDPTSRKQMMDLLQNFEQQETEEGETSEEQSMEDKFSSLNLNEADGPEIWSNLNDEEKAKFKSFIEDSDNLEKILPLKQPWWTSQTLNLVSELNSDESNELKDELATRPPFPLNVKNLSELTSAKPSNCIPYNLLNVLYIYAFLCRFYNFDVRDFLEEAVDSLFMLSPVLSQGHNYSELIESVQDSIRLITASHPELPISFVKSIVDDVSNLMLGPQNARPSTFVLCALHDIKLLLTELKLFNKEKGIVDKELRKKITMAIKKIEFYMSWASEYEYTLSEISADLLLIMLPDLIPETKVILEENAENVNVEKPLIEEIE